MNKRRPVLSRLDRFALILLAAEVTATLAIAVGYVVYGLLDHEFTKFGWMLAAAAALMGAGLAVATWGFARHKRFALGAVVTWQLMQLSVGVSVFSALPIVAVVLIVAAIVIAWAVMRRQNALARAESS